MTNVREHRPRAHEDLAPEDDAVPDARVALDARPGADDGARRHETEGAHDDVEPDDGPFGDDARGVNDGGSARMAATVHGPGSMRSAGRHVLASRPLICP
jgi:hypothetical protein